MQLIINKFYREPKSYIDKINRFGGYLEYKRMGKANTDMVKASENLPPVISFPDGLPVYFLTGEHFLYQTLFCIASLTKATPQKFRFIIVDDGTLDAATVKKKLPGALIITAAKIKENLDANLPEAIFPAIHRRRKLYGHLKKLTDIHTLTHTDWKLVLDSDMLFWKTPEQIISWLKEPEGNLFMKDSQRSYGYTEGLMQELCQAQIPHLLNVGVAGMQSSGINWHKVESWITELEASEGTSYYLEQALTAMLAASSANTLLPDDKYIVYPGKDEVKNKTGILHHYVDRSKKDYFMLAWKNFTTS